MVIDGIEGDARGRAENHQERRRRGRRQGAFCAVCNALKHDMANLQHAFRSSAGIPTESNAHDQARILWCTWGVSMMWCVYSLQAAEAAQQADGEGAEALTDAMEVENDAGPAADWDDDDDDDDLVALQQQGWVSALICRENRAKWHLLGQDMLVCNLALCVQAPSCDSYPENYKECTGKVWGVLTDVDWALQQEEEADAAPLEMLDAFAPAQATAQVGSLALQKEGI